MSVSAPRVLEMRFPHLLGTVLDGPSQTAVVGLLLIGGAPEELRRFRVNQGARIIRRRFFLDSLDDGLNMRSHVVFACRVVAKGAIRRNAVVEYGSFELYAREHVRELWTEIEHNPEHAWKSQ